MQCSSLPTIFELLTPHDSVGDSLQKLQDQGFDIASLHHGYGRALDFVMDGVVDSFAAINGPLQRILSRGWRQRLQDAFIAAAMLHQRREPQRVVHRGDQEIASGLHDGSG